MCVFVCVHMCVCASEGKLLGGSVYVDMTDSRIMHIFFILIEILEYNHRCVML